ncbi:MAG: hypothetical protein ILM98_14040 [Kiritimatiellae bacterium]|nr:hypothetical protein [Kiritimatiellia bacterium]
MDNNETLEDIEAKMREDARRVDAGMTCPNWAALLRDYADRIGAAIKRDAKEVCRETLKVASIVDAIHRFCEPEPLNTAAARNCDRFANLNEARNAFYQIYFGPTEPEFLDDAFEKWLFDKAEDGAPMNRPVGGQEGGAR